MQHSKVEVKSNRKTDFAAEEEEGLHGVFKRFCRRRRGVTRCVQAATPQRTPADKRKLQTVQH
jgi:hypothetical protein